MGQVWNVADCHGGRGWGSCHIGGHVGSQGQSSGFSSLTCWRSGLGDSEWPSQAQPLLGPGTRQGPSGPLSALTWELAVLHWGRGLGFQAPATCFI